LKNNTRPMTGFPCRPACLIPCASRNAVAPGTKFDFNCKREFGITADQIAKVIGELALLKISLKCKPGQLAQLFGNFALMNAALALVAATSLGRTNHALSLPALQTLQSQPVTSATSAASVSQALGIRDLSGTEPKPIGGLSRNVCRLPRRSAKFYLSSFSSDLLKMTVNLRIVSQPRKPLIAIIRTICKVSLGNC
jgi:hypothetical protein